MLKEKYHVATVNGKISAMNFFPHITDMNVIMEKVMDGNCETSASVKVTGDDTPISTYLMFVSIIFMLETCKSWKKMVDQLQMMIYNKTGRVKNCNKSFEVT